MGILATLVAIKVPVQPAIFTEVSLGWRILATLVAMKVPVQPAIFTEVSPGWGSWLR